MTSTKPVAIVTGSTRGIGFEVASELISKGWVVGINGRSQKDVQKVVEGLGENAFPLAFDVSNPESVQFEINQFVKSQGALEALIHCAGVMKDAPINLVEKELIEEVFKINVFSSFYLVKAASKAMIRKRRGSILLLSSIAGEDGAKGQSVYSASKGAVSALVKSTSKELSKVGIRVNAIAPGPIDTELFTGFPEELQAEIAASIPLGRIGTTKDVSKIISFLVSDDASFITGQIYRVDGGLST